MMQQLESTIQRLGSQDIMHSENQFHHQTVQTFSLAVWKSVIQTRARKKKRKRRIRQKRRCMCICLTQPFAPRREPCAAFQRTIKLQKGAKCQLFFSHSWEALTSFLIIRKKYRNSWNQRTPNLKSRRRKEERKGRKKKARLKRLQRRIEVIIQIKHYLRIILLLFNSTQLKYK